MITIKTTKLISKTNIWRLNFQKLFQIFENFLVFSKIAKKIKKKQKIFK